MMSDKTLSERYTSFWNQSLPGSNQLIRNINISAERVCAPLSSVLGPDIRGVVNEAAFMLFEEVVSGSRASEDVIMENAWKRACSYVHRIQPSVSLDLPLTLAVKRETVEVSNRLKSHFFRSPFAAVVCCRPVFPGCGALSACEGDVLVGSRLCEVKAGDRGFRKGDIKQLLIYCTLDYASGQRSISEVELFNPRTGKYFRSSLDELVQSAAFTTPTVFFQELIEFVNRGTY